MAATAGPSCSARRDILKAVADEEAILLGGYFFLPADQIRGKALKNLGIPQRFGGKVDWARIGPDFRVRSVYRPPRQACTNYKFFKTRRPRTAMTPPRIVVRAMRRMAHQHHDQVRPKRTRSTNQDRDEAVITPARDGVQGRAVRPVKRKHLRVSSVKRAVVQDMAGSVKSRDHASSAILGRLKPKATQKLAFDDSATAGYTPLSLSGQEDPVVIQDRKTAASPVDSPMETPMASAILSPSVRSPQSLSSEAMAPVWTEDVVNFTVSFPDEPTLQDPQTLKRKSLSPEAADAADAADSDTRVDSDSVSSPAPKRSRGASPSAPARSTSSTDSTWKSAAKSSLSWRTLRSPPPARTYADDTEDEVAETTTADEDSISTTASPSTRGEPSPVKPLLDVGVGKQLGTPVSRSTTVSFEGRKRREGSTSTGSHGPTPPTPRTSGTSRSVRQLFNGETEETKSAVHSPLLSDSLGGLTTTTGSGSLRRNISNASMATRISIGDESSVIESRRGDRAASRTPSSPHRRPSWPGLAEVSDSEETRLRERQCPSTPKPKKVSRMEMSVAVTRQTPVMEVPPSIQVSTVNPGSDSDQMSGRTSVSGLWRLRDDSSAEPRTSRVPVPSPPQWCPTTDDSSDSGRCSSPATPRQLKPNTSYSDVTVNATLSEHNTPCPPPPAPLVRSKPKMSYSDFTFNATLSEHNTPCPPPPAPLVRSKPKMSYSDFTFNATLSEHNTQCPPPPAPLVRSKPKMSYSDFTFNATLSEHNTQCPPPPAPLVRSKPKMSYSDFTCNATLSEHNNPCPPPPAPLGRSKPNMSYSDFSALSTSRQPKPVADLYLLPSPRNRSEPKRSIGEMSSVSQRPPLSRRLPGGSTPRPLRSPPPPAGQDLETTGESSASRTTTSTSPNDSLSGRKSEAGSTPRSTGTPVRESPATDLDEDLDDLSDLSLSDTDEAGWRSVPPTPRRAPTSRSRRDDPAMEVVKRSLFETPRRPVEQVPWHRPRKISMSSFPSSPVDVPPSPLSASPASPQDIDVSVTLSTRSSVSSASYRHDGVLRSPEQPDISIASMYSPL